MSRSTPTSTPTSRRTAPSRSTSPRRPSSAASQIAITDHVDFDPRDPAFEYTRYEDRERTVRDAAERWAGRGVVIRFGAELTFNRLWRRTSGLTWRGIATTT